MFTNVDVGFQIGQGMLPWQPIIGAKSAVISDTPSFLGLAFHNRWRMGKRMGMLTLNSAEVLSASYKNLMNFGPLTLEFTVMAWRPFMRKIREMRSILETRIRQRHKPLNGFVPNSHGRCVWCFARTTLNVKVKSQRSRSSGTKNTLCTHNTPVVWTKWKGLVADNATQAANTSI